MRRAGRALAAAAGAMAPGFVSNALADKFPSKSVIGMMGFPPGGGLERSSRVFFPAWMKTLGATRPSKFTFLPGAGGGIPTRRAVLPQCWLD